MTQASEYAVEQFKVLKLEGERLTSVPKITNIELFNLLANSYRIGFRAAAMQEGRVNDFHI